MKLVFLCTSLAEGRDGVGDYVRRLAGACADQGHRCLLIALNDRNVPGPTLQTHETEVRMGASLSWPRRARALADTLRAFDPDWISWQIVPYGFHPKGILPAGVFQLLEVVRPWRNQVMLHELWVGLARNDPVLLRVTGLLQRRRLLLFLRRLRPSCVHTTNPAYQLALASDGWPSELLPLFGNMPVLPRQDERSRSELARIAPRRLPPDPHWLGVIFGTIHPQWQPGPTLAFLDAAAEIAGRPMALLALGRAGTHGTRLLAELSRRPGRIQIVDAGPQPPETISLVLHAADFGVATHPWGLIEKSGTTATLLEHGLPVLVPRDDWQLRHRHAALTSRDPLLRRLADLPPGAFPRWLTERREPEARLPGLATRFLQQLNEPVAGGALVA